MLKTKMSFLEWAFSRAVKVSGQRNCSLLPAQTLGSISDGSAVKFLRPMGKTWVEFPAPASTLKHGVHVSDDPVVAFPGVLLG